MAIIGMGTLTTRLTQIRGLESFDLKLKSEKPDIEIQKHERNLRLHYRLAKNLV